MQASVEDDLLSLAEDETGAESRWNRPRKRRIVETTLPKPAGEFASNGQPPGNAQLHGLNYLRGIAY